MRTEFAVLTGIEGAQLGYARFYPYAFVRCACASLASWFKRGGYQTQAIHPYYADFFGRDRAFKHLQIDRFLDIASFKDAPRAGPYVGDMAVAESIIARARRTARQARLHLRDDDGKPRAAAPRIGAGRRGRGIPHARRRARWRDLTAYLRHLANADAMLGRLLSALRARRRDTVLCFYGDHVPALPHVFGELGCEPTRSDYFIWRNYGERPPRMKHLRADNSGLTLIEYSNRACLAGAPARTLHPMKNDD